MNAGFHREVDENSAFPAYYAVSSDNFLLTFPDNLMVPVLIYFRELHNVSHSTGHGLHKIQK
jgi:hypothetical protein